jgi:hypothetical protein
MPAFHAPAETAPHAEPALEPHRGSKVSSLGPQVRISPVASTETGSAARYHYRQLACPRPGERLSRSWTRASPPAIVRVVRAPVLRGDPLGSRPPPSSIAARAASSSSQPRAITPTALDAEREHLAARRDASNRAW